jgi:hypothetical protein
LSLDGVPRSTESPTPTALQIPVSKAQSQTEIVSRIG